MTLILYAQPYDSSAEGFYFRSSEEYDKQVPTVKNNVGDRVEEFEIQFIDGEEIDGELAKTMEISQGNFRRFIELVDQWEDHEKLRFIIAVGECGYKFDLDNDSIDLLDVDIYEEDSLRDLAIQFVDQGIFGDIPQSIQFYIDYGAIARDLSMDYAETVIAGMNLVYRCG